jgi:hypothetical protein
MIKWLADKLGYTELELRPTRQDIRLLEMFVTRGVAQKDVEQLLDVTSTEFDSWQRNKDVDRIMKLKPAQNPEKFTLHHPDLEGMTELAFESGLRKYYRFKDDFRMPTGRYKYVYKRFKEYDMRMSREILIAYLEQIKTTLNGGEKGGKVNLFNISRTVYNMETWLTLPFEPGAIKRLAAVIYFTEDEDLSTFDEKEGQSKIEWWEANGTHDFFSTAPIGELLNLSSTYSASLPESLQEMTQIVKDLTSDLLEKSPEN